LYEIFQVAGDEAAVSYDDTKYEVEVQVFAKEIDGKLWLLPQISGSMEKNSGEKVRSLSFENEYDKPDEAETTEAETTVAETTAAETTVAETTVPETTHGGGGGSDGPSGTKPSTTETVKATEPQTTETESETESETAETQEKPVYPDLSEIPLNPDGTPDIPEKTEIEIFDLDNPSEPVYRGPYSDDIDLPAGRYEIVMLDDEGVPQAAGIFTIDEEGVAKGALPKTGDTSLPFVLLALVMTGSVIGIGVLGVRIRKMNE
jgi:LPXTG-motif cell wall-anchored protein